MNPFNPNFGRMPQLFLDRDQIVQDYVTEINEGFDTPVQTTVIYGVRGAGKTALLTDICNQLQQRDWLVINLIGTGEILASLVSQLYHMVTPPLQKAFNHIQGVQVAHIGVSFTTETPETTAQYQFILMTMLRKVAAHHMRVMLVIDEVKSTKSMRTFASLYQLFIRENLPVALIMTGLPENISELQNNSVLTFLLRSHRIELHPLNPAIMIQSFAKKFSEGKRQVSMPLLNRITSLTHGYAYAFQLIGYLIWKHTQAGDVIDERLINDLLPEYQLGLSRNAYTKIYQDLSEHDRLFIRAMAAESTAKVKMKQIQERTHKPVNYLSNYRQRLLASQIIQRAGYGYVSFTLPLFKEFVQWYGAYDDAGF
ncbi:ATP-binding protein [Ligilactobacillus sp. LYQ60]|uniref:ATP-binding protein n=1 Tax=Ligilactobacillus sp. LYQ60 TaxID=3378799 RepID=UPI003851887D